MKILHVITSLYTGGAEHLMVDLLPRFREYGHEVSILLFDGTRTPFYEELENLGIHILSIGQGPKSMHNPFLVFKLKKYINQYDIIHTHNTPCQLLVALASFISKKTILITTEHNTSNSRRSWGWYKPIDRWMYKTYHKTICVSKEAENNLKAYLKDSRLDNTICTIPNGVDTKRFSLAKPIVDFKKTHASNVVIMMVAGFRKQKDQKTLIKAISILPSNYHLFLIGNGECLQECQEESNKLNISERVHFLGIRTDIPSLLKSSDYIVLSSHYEGLSLSSIEGMACGKPFLASDVDGLRDIVGGAGVLFPCGDDQALAREILKLQEDQELYQQVAEKCQQRAMQYDISKMAERYLEIYNNIIR